MSNPFEEMAEAFEDAAETIDQAFDQPAEEPEERDVDPLLYDVSVDVGETPEFTFPELEETLEEIDTALTELEQGVGAETLATEEFWNLLDQQTEADIPEGGIAPPDADRGSEFSPFAVIEETDPATLVEPRATEGEVETITDPEEIGTITVERWTDTLAQVRSLDQQLDDLDEAQRNIQSARDIIAERVEDLREDVDRLEDAISERPENVEDLIEAREQAEEEIAVGEAAIEEADAKVAAIEERGNDIRRDRNAYRAEVKAIRQAAQMADRPGLVDELTEAYRGYRIRSPDDVHFRPDVVRHVLSAMNTFQSRGQLPVPPEQLIGRVQETWDHSDNDVDAALSVLTTTGELRATPQGFDFSVLRGI